MPAATDVVTTDTLDARLDALFAPYPTPIGRDLRANLGRALLGGALAPLDAAPALLALAELTGDRAIGEAAMAWMASLGFPAEQVREAREAAGIVTMLDTYYGYRAASEDDAVLGEIGLSAGSLVRPALGKTRFTMLAYAVSVANGSASGITGHGRALRAAGASLDQLHDLARLAAVVKAASRLP